jgi:hypothetical protein
MPGNQHVRRPQPLHEAAFLAAFDEVIDQYAEPTVWCGVKLRDPLGQSIHTVE